MVRVTGRTGKVVDIQMFGIAEVARRLKITAEKMESGITAGIVRAGAFVEGEVKESIIGNRAEPKSVETGLLGRSIEFKKTGKAQGIVKPKKKTYPGTKTTTIDTANLMEFSPNISGGPRRHFRNTQARTQNKVKEIIQTVIKLGK